MKAKQETKQRSKSTLTSLTKYPKSKRKLQYTMLKIPILIIISLFLGGAQAQGTDFQCRKLDATQDLDITKSFDSVAPGLAVDNCKKQKSLVPKIMHWHVISIPAGEPARISTFPEGLVTPFVKSGTLKFDIQKDVMDGFQKGDTIEAGVSIFLPPNQMKKVIIEGVDVVVEIMNNLTSSELESLMIECSGVDNTVYVSSPNARVEYEGSGVDITAIIEAASGSSIDLSGVDQSVRIKTGDDLDVTMSGIDQELTIEGAYNKIESSGIDNKISVNGPTRCDNIDNSGISNSCSTTDEVVMVPELSCLASSKVQKWKCSNWGWSTSAAVGGGIALLVVLILLCGLSCWGCYKCCGGGHQEQTMEPNQGQGAKQSHAKQPNASGTGPGAEEGGTGVLEAEVISHTSMDDQASHGDNQSRFNDQTASKSATLDSPVLEAEIIVDGTNDRDARAEKDLIAAETGLGNVF
jgi:hypothetical protein